MLDSHASVVSSRYGRCVACGHIKQRDPGSGLIVEHRRYAPLFASSVIGRCDGSGSAAAGEE
jgi:hypothetical protein